MPDQEHCSGCGAEILSTAPRGVCTRCLLLLGLDPGEPTQTSETTILPDHEGSKIQYFGDYELVEEIGRGGMGIVFKARQVSLNRLVALKLISAGTFASPELVKRFKGEAEAAARLSHPAIVPIFEIGEHQRQHYFSMGLVDGPSLSKWLGRKPLPVREAARLVRVIALAL